MDPSRLEERVADPSAEDGYDRVDQRAMADTVRELRNDLGDREQRIAGVFVGGAHGKLVSSGTVRGLGVD